MLINWLTALSLVMLLVTVLFGTAVYWFTVMPGESWRGPPPDLTPAQQTIADTLRRHVIMLADTIGERNLQNRVDALYEARDYLHAQLAATGLATHNENFSADLGGFAIGHGEVELTNVVATQPGSDDSAGIILIGAHYDTVPGSPGANDNGSGLAALLVLAEHFAKYRYTKTIRLVAFVNEESPYFGTDAMGSRRHLQLAQKNGDHIDAMFSLETIGAYSEEASSQNYPTLFRFLYPTTGNFVGFIGNVASRSLVHTSISVFRENASVASEGVAAPSLVKDAARSDHAAYWGAGISALMVTDTANFRYSQYHQPDDTSAVISYDYFAHVVSGLQAVIDHLAQRAD